MNGIIYTRVSSDEQVKGMSLAFQQSDCFRYARERNITVVKTFEERGESAKFANRPELVALLEYCRRNKQQVNALVVWKLDRLSRNQMDYYFIKRTLLEYGVALYSATEPSLDNTSSIAGKVFETFSALQAEIDNTVRRERAIRGMEAKIEVGIHPWKPPLGYLCAQNRLKGLKKTEPDKPDPNRFPIIQQLFRMCREQRICGNVELAAMANRYGLRTERGTKIYPQLIDRIMGNKFYAGILINPWKRDEIEGKHHPAISRDEFYVVQLLRKGKVPHAPKHHRTEHPDFPLRKIVMCGACRAALTGSWSRGNGGAYAYYHCPKRQCSLYGKAIRKADLEAAFAQKLEEITPKPGQLEVFKATLIDQWRQRKATLAVATEERMRQTKTIEQQLDALIDMRVRNLLTDDEFLSRKERLTSELAELRLAPNHAPTSDHDVEALAAYAADFVTSLPGRWRRQEPNLKRRFQQHVFPEGISFERDHGFGTAKPGLLYKLSRDKGELESYLVHPAGATWNQVLDELNALRAPEDESSSPSEVALRQQRL